MVLDGSQALTSNDRELLRSVCGKKSLVVINKSDLPQAFDFNVVESCAEGATILFVSAKEGDGLAELKHYLRNLVLGSDREPPVVVTNLRHRSALMRSEEALSRVLVTLRNGYPAELIAVDLNEAREALEEIVGTVSSEDILERIFSHFCIGK